MPLRILHLVTNADLGGAPRVVTELARSAVDAGHECGVAAMKAGPFWEALDDRVQRFPLRHIRREINPFQDMLCLFEIAQLYRSFRPDIIHLHSSKMGVLGRLATGLVAHGRLRRRVVYTIHGFDTILKAHRVFLPLERLLAKRCGAVVPVSSYDEANLRAAGINGNIRKIHNGVSDRANRLPLGREALVKMQSARNAGRQVVLSIARLAPPKRFDLFAGLAESFRSRSSSDSSSGRPLSIQSNSSQPVQFFWIGNVQDAAYAAAQLGKALPENLLLLGEQAEAGDYANYCDVFVLLSEYEGLPMSVLEAMSCGKPVLASAVGGLSEALGDGSGILVGNEPSELEAAMTKLLEDSDRLSVMGGVARIRYESSFSAEAMWTKYESLYKELCT